MIDIDKAYSVIQPGFRFNRHGIEKPLSPKQIQHKICMMNRKMISASVRELLGSE